MTASEAVKERLPHYEAFEMRSPSVNVKRAIILLHRQPANEDRVPYWMLDRKEVLIGINNGRLRLRYPDYSKGKINYIDDASMELKSLSALWICQLLPTYVLADALQESHPEHSEAAATMRQWDQIRMEKESSK